MRTRSIISTISYNTPEFLSVKLEDLRRAKVVSEWYFIEHQPEADEKKVHIHLLVVPSKQLQTDDLGECFIQPDPPNPPRKCLWWEVTKDFQDWYLYSIHDPEYLISKAQSREWVYSIEQVVAHDRDYLEERVSKIDRSNLTPISIVKKYVNAGLDFSDLLASGSVPITQSYAYKLAFDTLGQHLARNGRQTHTPINAENYPSAEEHASPELLSELLCKQQAEGENKLENEIKLVELAPGEDLPF